MIKVKYDVSRTPETKENGTYEVPVEIDARGSTDIRLRSRITHAKKDEELTDAVVIFKGSTDNAEISFDCPDGFKCLMKVDSYDAVDIYSQLIGEMAEYGLALDEKIRIM